MRGQQPIGRLLVTAIPEIQPRMSPRTVTTPGVRANDSPKASRGRRLVRVAALVAFVTACLYVPLILREGNNAAGQVIVWAGVALVSTVTLAAAAGAHDVAASSRLTLMGSAILAVLGVLSLPTIGVGYLVAAIVGLVGGRLIKESA